MKKLATNPLTDPLTKESCKNSILKFLLENSPAPNVKIRRQINLSASQTSALLRELISEKKIDKIGEKAHTTYYISEIGKKSSGVSLKNGDIVTNVNNLPNTNYYLLIINDKKSLLIKVFFSSEKLIKEIKNIELNKKEYQEYKVLKTTPVKVNLEITLS